MALPSPPIAQQGGDIDVDQLYRRIALLESRSQDPSSVAITGGSIFPSRPRFYGFGDSITADGGRTINGTAAPDVNVYRYSWHRYAEYATQGRFQWGGSFGLSGLTIAQLRATYLPYALNYCVPGDYVVVLMGQNSYGTLSAQDLTDYTFVVTSMLAKGLRPILCTLTPSSTARVFHALNAFIRNLAATYSLTVVDMTAAVIDPATGIWLAANTRDGGTHPSETGAVVMGNALATVLNAIPTNAYAQMWLADSDAGYGPSRTTQTGGSIIPTFQTDDAGTPPLSTNWALLSGSYAGATTFASAAKGRSCTFTASATQLVARHTVSTAVPGDKMRCSFWLTATVAASSANWGFAIQDGAGNAFYDSGRNNAHRPVVDLPRSFFSIDFTHSGTNGVLFDLIVTGAGGLMKLEQFTILNLTSMGVA